MNPTANPVANMPDFLQTSLGREYSRLVSSNDETVRLAQIRQLTERALEPIRRKSARPDVLSMPSNGTRLQQISSIALPVNGSTNIVVISYRVPVGHEGYVTAITNAYSLGFREGSGDLTWQIVFGNATAASGSALPAGANFYPYYLYGAITVSLGSLTAPQWTVGGNGLPIRENQYILYLVSVAANAQVNAGGQILCGLFGWLKPL